MSEGVHATVPLGLVETLVDLVLADARVLRTGAVVTVYKSRRPAVGSDRVTWTGPHHQLAFVVFAVDDYCLELRAKARLGTSEIWAPIFRERDPTRLMFTACYFAVKETQGNGEAAGMNDQERAAVHQLGLLARARVDRAINQMDRVRSIPTENPNKPTSWEALEAILGPEAVARIRRE